MTVLLYILACLFAVLIAFEQLRRAKTLLGRVVRLLVWCAPLVCFLVLGVATGNTFGALIFSFCHILVWAFFSVEIDGKA